MGRGGGAQTRLPIDAAPAAPSELLSALVRESSKCDPRVMRRFRAPGDRRVLALAPLAERGYRIRITDASEQTDLDEHRLDPLLNCARCDGLCELHALIAPATDTEAGMPVNAVWYQELGQQYLNGPATDPARLDLVLDPVLPEGVGPRRVQVSLPSERTWLVTFDTEQHRFDDRSGCDCGRPYCFGRWIASEVLAYHRDLYVYLCQRATIREWVSDRLSRVLRRRP